MEENFKNKFGFIIFILIVLFLAIGGYFFKDYVLNEDNKKIDDTKEEIRIDKNKDYLYFKDENMISEEAEIDFKNVVINLKTQETLNDTLEKENRIYKNNIKYISKMNLPTDEVINYNNDDLYSLTFRNYETYDYDDYVSLVIKDYNYTCFDSVTFNDTKSYVFNKINGELLDIDELLDIYDLTMDDVKNKVREYLNSKQAIDNDVEVIKIDDTINNLENNLFYINDYGKLCISYLVKTTQVDYNETMEVS